MSVPLVRQPVQARALAKREAVLDVASRIAERGTEKLTVAAIAAEADIAVGTLYQYFEGVDAVVEAIVKRHLDRFNDLIVQTFANHTFSTATQASLEVVETFVRYYRTEPGFRVVWFGPLLTRHHQTMDAANNKRLAQTMYEQLLDQGLITRNKTTQTIVTANWEVADRLIALAFKASPNGDATVIRHLNAIITQAT